MPPRFILIQLTAVAICFTALAAAPLEVQSPDGNVIVTFTLPADGAPAYRIEYFGKPVVLESHLGFEPAFTNGFKLAAAAMTRHSGSWTNAFGERRIVPDNYGEMKVDLKHQSGKLLQSEERRVGQAGRSRWS